MDYEEMSNEELHQILKERLQSEDVIDVEDFNRQTVISLLKISDQDP